MQKVLCSLLVLSSVAIARPQWQKFCDMIPKNPDASQIGAAYLTIPGCEGTSGAAGSAPGSGSGSGSGSSSGSSSVAVVAPVSTSPTVVTGAKGAKADVKPGLPSSTPSSAITLPSTEQKTETGIIPVANSTTSIQPGAGAGTGSTDAGGSYSGDSSTGSGSTSGNITSGGSTGGGGSLSQSFKSTVTRYGQGPPGTSGTDHECQTNQGSCGNNPKSGWTAAASQFLYFNGASGTPSAGCGAEGSPGCACGTCWSITGTTDGSGGALTTTPITVLITNECAMQGPGEAVNLCGQSSLAATNSLGANVNIDLCMDSGAAGSFFGGPNDATSSNGRWGLAVGTAQQVDCMSNWCGVFANGTKSGPAGCTTAASPWAATT